MFHNRLTHPKMQVYHIQHHKILFTNEYNEQPFKLTVLSFGNQCKITSKIYKYNSLWGRRCILRKQSVGKITSHSP